MKQNQSAAVVALNIRTNFDSAKLARINAGMSAAERDRDRKKKLCLINSQDR